MEKNQGMIIEKLNSITQQEKVKPETLLKLAPPFQQLYPQKTDETNDKLFSDLNAIGRNQNQNQGLPKEGAEAGAAEAEKEDELELDSLQRFTKYKVNNNYANTIAAYNHYTKAVHSRILKQRQRQMKMLMKMKKMTRS